MASQWDACGSAKHSLHGAGEDSDYDAATMKTYFARVRGVRHPAGLVDLTDAVRTAFAESGISRGRVTVTPANADDRVLMNERESGLFRDLQDVVKRVGRTALLVGTPGVTLPADDGRVVLGDWQRVLLCAPNGDPGPSAVCHVMGE